MSPLPHLGASWRDVDLDEVITGIEDGTLAGDIPDQLRVQGGGFLLYSGKVHGIHGLSGSGKTWVAALAVAERLTGGGHVIFVDLEDRPRTLVERLMALCVTADQVRGHLHYKRPHEPLEAGLAELYDTVTRYQPQLMVIDSVGEALALDGANPNADEEVATWMRHAARGVAERGPAVLLIDHVPKSDERALLPIGSQRKQAALDGAVYSLQVITPFSKEKKGMAKLVCGKDRAGHYARGQVVAELHVDPTPGSASITLKAPASAPRSADGTFRPTALMEKISRLLEDSAAPLTTNQIRDGVKGADEYRRMALKMLVDEHYVATLDGARGAVMHTCIMTYRQDDDPQVNRESVQ